MLLTSVVSLSVFCSISGGLFVVAARMYQQECAVSERVATSYAYLLEAAGSGLGGVLTSVLLLRFFGSLQIALMVALLNAVVATSLLLGLNRRKAAAVALAGVILAVPLLTYVAPSLDRSARQRQWKGFRVLESRDTIYGNLTVVETGALRSIYDNGVILASMPDEASAEEAVHYALLEHPAPARVLLIGGAANGSIVQALEHPTLRRLDYVELDPAVVEIFRGIAPAESVRALSDARVRVHYADGRLWLRSTTETFDAIVLDLPNPQTAQLNRFYTEEFFRSARDSPESRRSARVSGAVVGGLHQSGAGGVSALHQRQSARSLSVCSCHPGRDDAFLCGRAARCADRRSQRPDCQVEKPESPAAVRSGVLHPLPHDAGPDGADP
jgi:spermidine synthase